MTIVGQIAKCGAAVLPQVIFNFQADMLKNLSPPEAYDEIADIKADESVLGNNGLPDIEKGDFVRLFTLLLYLNCCLSQPLDPKTRVQ
jgi:hypothetical protein